MTPEQAADARVNPFDLTKVWSQKEFPRHEVGRLTLDRNAENYFGDVEQAGFDPGNFVPASGPPRTRCSRAGCSPTATPIGTGSASTTPSCR